MRIANRDGGLPWLQAAEFVLGLTIQRSAFAQINGMQVISGALSGFRAEALRSIGGYSSDTLVEDMDVTVEMGSRGRVLYNPEAIAYTEGPRSWRDLLSQRFRWTYGGFQALGKHKAKIFRPKYGALGMVGLPYFLIGPWLVVLMALGLLFVVAATVLGAISLATFLMIMIVALLVQGALSALAVVLDNEDPKLILYGALMPLVMAGPTALTTLRSGYALVRRSEIGWTKLQRFGANVLPETDAHQGAPASRPVACVETDPLALDEFAADRRGVGLIGTMR